MPPITCLNTACPTATGTHLSQDAADRCVKQAASCGGVGSGSAGAQAQKAGTQYELDLTVNLANTAKTAAACSKYKDLKVWACPPAGGGAKSDLVCKGRLAFQQALACTTVQKIEIEAKHIKAQSTMGLDFGQFTMQYLYNKTDRTGVWIPNTNGKNWQVIKNGIYINRSLILNVVQLINQDKAAMPNIADSINNHGFPLSWEGWKNPPWTDGRMGMPAKEVFLRGVGIMTGPSENYALIAGVFHNFILAISNSAGWRHSGGRWTARELVFRGTATGRNELGVKGGEHLVTSILSFYQAKGDAFIQIKQYGLYALSNRAPAPPAWLAKPPFFFANALKTAKIVIRIRYKNHSSSSPTGYKDFNCGIKFDMSRDSRSPYNLDDAKQRAELVNYWCANYMAVAATVFRSSFPEWIDDDGNIMTDDPNDKPNMAQRASGLILYKEGVEERCAMQGGTTRRRRTPTAAEAAAEEKREKAS